MAETNTPKNTINLSSRTTVFLKFFLPTLWIVFFGMLTLAILFSGNVSFGGYSPTLFRTCVVVIFLSFLGIMYFAFMNLKRVEIDQDYIYITNYVKIYKYPFNNIGQIKETSFGFFKIVHVYFRVPGYFGPRIYFIAGGYYKPFFDKHPKIKEQLNIKDAA